MTDTIEDIATDFLHFNPQVLPNVEPAENIILIIGSERGFCGDFNEKIVRQLKSTIDLNLNKNSTIIAVGSKLHTLLNESDPKITFIEGASVVEDIVNVVETLARILTASNRTISLEVLSHNNHNNEILLEQLLPPFKECINKEVTYTHPPLLNLTNQEFFLDLTEHYLFNSLHRILYVSLMIENQRRIQHLESATHHLDEKTEELKHKIYALRQEEIIEEIEVILLSSSTK